MAFSWIRQLLCLLCAALASLSAEFASAQGSGAVVIDFLEEKSEEPLACRVQIQDVRGRNLRGRGTLFHGGWNLVEDGLTFRGRVGEYRYRTFHGPQVAAANGTFTLDTNSEGYDAIYMPRHANLLEESWYAGDLAAFLPPLQVERWMKAEDLHMSVVPQLKTSPKEKDAKDISKRESGEVGWVESQSYFDSRPGSGLVLHHWSPPADVPQALPSSRLLVLAKDEPAEFGLPVHAEIARLWARDVPIWLASKRIDSIQVLSSHLTLTGKGGTAFKPIVDPQPGRFRGDLGPGRLVENIYWKVLDTGLRIPPSAGSGFGKVDSVLGYNRVYVSCPSSSASDWWRGLRQGNSFVTSGPLLRVSVNGQDPGAIFRSDETVELDVALTLTVSDPVSYLDVIFNGRKIYEARLDEYAKQGGKIPTLSVAESGWLVVRVVTDRDFTYRIASTAPFYCEVGGEPHVSKSAVEFFQVWLEESAKLLEKSEQSGAAVPFVEAARKFWRDRLALANAP